MTKNWIDKSRKYGCRDCYDRYKRCKISDPCKYAYVLDEYEQYSDYLKASQERFWSVLAKVCKKNDD